MNIIANGRGLRSQPTVDPWEKQPNESDRAWTLFKAYRDIEGTRTFVKVAEAFGCSDTNVREIAERWDWAFRVDTYDRMVDREERARQSRERTTMRRRQAKAGVAMQSIAATRLLELQAKIAAGERLDLSVTEIIRLIDVGCRLERTARGEDREDEITKIVVNVGRYTDPPEPAPADPSDDV